VEAFIARANSCLTKTYSLNKASRYHVRPAGPTTASLSLHLPPPTASYLPFFLPSFPPSLLLFFPPSSLFLHFFLLSTSLPTCPPAYVPTFWHTPNYTRHQPTWPSWPCCAACQPSSHYRRGRLLVLSPLGVQRPFHNAMVLGIC
jgi:hypothetical protein